MAQNFRTFVVANPQAGAGIVRREWERVDRLLRAQIPELDIAFTEGPGHATLLAREAIRAGWEMVVAVGGDGTINEVVNGFVDKPKADELFCIDPDGFVVRSAEVPALINPDAVLGLLPMGTGGDFRRSVGLMGGVNEAVERLGGTDTRRVDLGQVAFLDNSRGELACRRFINIASCGFSGDVDRYVNRGWKGLGGKASFRLGSVRAWLKWRNAELTVRLDDVEEIQQRFVNLVVANGAFFGGGMWVAPGADLDDGAFQVVFLGDLDRLQLIRLTGKIYTGHHLELEQVFRRRARRVSVRPAPGDEILLDVDGEQPGRAPALYELQPGAIRLKI